MNSLQKSSDQITAPTHLRVPASRKPAPVGNSELVMLLAQTSEGCRRSFSQLYQLTSPFMFAVALRVVKNREIAEEMLQEAYIIAWRKADKYDPQKGAVHTWLATIIRNLSIDCLRRKLLKTVPEDEAAQIECSAPTPLELAATSEAQQVLADRLSRLPADMSKAISLAYYCGYTHEEIGQMMNVPRNTVKSWIRRGLQKLEHSFQLPIGHYI